jgi:hypothetical protein
MSEDLQPAPLSGAWDSALLGPVAELNEQMLECLRLMAASDSGDAAGRLVGLLHADWRTLRRQNATRWGDLARWRISGATCDSHQWERYSLVMCSDCGRAPGAAGQFQAPVQGPENPEKSPRKCTSRHERPSRQRRRRRHPGSAMFQL